MRPEAAGPRRSHRSRPPRAAALAIVAILLATASALSGCSKTSGSSAAFCKDLKAAPTLASIVAGYTQADSAELTARLTSARTTFARLRTDAPRDVRSSVATLVQAVDVVLDSVAAHPSDPSAASTAIRARASTFADVASASAEVSRYAKDTCGFALDAGGLPGAADTTTTAGAVTTTVAAGTPAATTTSAG